MSLGQIMNISEIVDMMAALAVTALLAEGYGFARRQFLRAAWAPIVLGVIFGIMACVQMYNPLHPFDGVIVDLRCIPIALAGAFLGWRGLLPCIAIAAAVRLNLGGVGVEAGLWGMMIAGLAGMIWARKMAHVERRNLGMLVLLALAMSAHLLGALALPRDMAIWFFTAAAGPMLLMNLIAVPLIGSLLERENQRIAQDNTMAAAITRDAASGLLTPAAFVRDMTNAYAVRAFGTFSGFVKITPHSGPLLGFFDGFRSRAEPFVDQHFLAQHLEHGDLAGQGQNGCILVPLSDVEMTNANRITHELRHALRSGVARPASSTPFELSIIEALDPARFLQIVDAVVVAEDPGWTKAALRPERSPLQPGAASMVRRSRIFDPHQHDGLFAKAEFLIDRSHT